MQSNRHVIRRDDVYRGIPAYPRCAEDTLMRMLSSSRHPIPTPIDNPIPYANAASTPYLHIHDDIETISKPISPRISPGDTEMRVRIPQQQRWRDDEAQRLGGLKVMTSSNLVG